METLPVIGRRRSGLIVFVLAMAAWLLLGMADVSWNLLTAYHLPPEKSMPAGELFARNLPIWVAAGLLTPLVVWLSRRVPFRRGRMLRTGWTHFGGLVAFILLHAALVGIFATLRAGKPVALESLALYVRGYLAWGLDREVLLFVVIVGLVQAIDYYGRFRERERAAAALELERARLQSSLSEARLEALRMQLQPHFLFNTLNAISTLILRNDTEAAQQMLQQLSRFLRMTLERNDAQTVTLETELEFLDAYLRIQQVRFTDRLQVEVQIAPEARSATVPCLVLQPLVENSIRHGLDAEARDARIVIRGECVGGRLRLTVEDNGCGLPEERERAEGTGLRNVRERLEQLYPGKHRFALRARPQGGTEAMIEIPRACTARRDDPAGQEVAGDDGPRPGYPISAGGPFVNKGSLP